MVRRVLSVEQVGSFGVTVKCSNHAGEGGEGFIGARTGEGDVFGGDDTLADVCVGRDVVGR